MASTETIIDGGTTLYIPMKPVNGYPSASREGWA